MIKFLSFKGTINQNNDIKSVTTPQNLTENKLERTPDTDSFQLQTTPIATKKIKTTINTTQQHSETLKKLEFVTKEKLLTQEVLYFLQPKIDTKGNKTFTQNQTKIIDLANDKIKFFKAMATELANDAEKYGDSILKDVKEIFGGKEGLGKYLVVRKKDKTSVYNKLVKSFKNERVKSEIHDIFARKLYKTRYSLLDKTDKDLVALSISEGEVKLDSKDFKIMEDAFKSDPKDYYAKKYFGTVYDKLSKQDKNRVKDIVFQENGKATMSATTKQARYEAKSYVKDLVGLRLILPTGNRTEMAKVEKYLENAIMTGSIKMTRMSNYHANHILPYIKQDKARFWKELTGMELIENNEVRKRNGYTTTQINIEHPIPNKSKSIFAELQIRTKALNDIGNKEHLIYDIIEKKNISKDIPQLKEYYDSIGIEKAVNEVFNNEAKEQRYTDYERAYYSFIRNKETNDKHVSLKKPLLAEYELGEYEHLLSFDALGLIDKKAQEIRATFGKKQTEQK